MSESMDKYYKEFFAGIAGAKLGSMLKPCSLAATEAGARAARKTVQKKAKGMKKGGVVK